MGEYGRETLTELLLGCLYYYGMLLLVWCVVGVPVCMAMHNMYRAVFIDEEVAPDGDA